MRRINETLITNGRNYITQRCYRANRVKKETLCPRISPLGNPDWGLTPELDDWIRKRNQVRVDEILRTVLNLRRRKQYSEALQVSEWMKSRHVCVFTPTEHAIQLDLIGKTQGLVDAFGYYMSLNEQDKTDKTFGALLHRDAGDKALSHLQKMKESGVTSSSLTYNDIMSLYSYGTGLLMELACLCNRCGSDNYSRPQRRGKYWSKQSR
ncbi:hypothetical protein ACET3Z_028670 [Daucus carota]